MLSIRAGFVSLLSVRLHRAWPITLMQRRWPWAHQQTHFGAIRSAQLAARRCGNDASVSPPMLGVLVVAHARHERPRG